MSDKIPHRTLLSTLKRLLLALLFAFVLFPALTASAQTNATMSGRVTNSKGEPIAEVRVVLYKSRDINSNRYYTTTDANGEYTVSGINPDTYYVAFRAPSLSYRNEFYDNQKSLSSATAVTVTAESVLTGYDAVLPNSGRIVGTVLGADANPIAAINVESSYWNGITHALQDTTITDSSGVFTIEVGNDNPHNLFFFDSNRDYFPRYYKTHKGIDGSDTLVATAEETITITVALSRTHTISGAVVDELGLPVAGVTVAVFGKEGSNWHTYGSTTTDDSGSYRFERLGWAGRNYYLNEYHYRLYFSGGGILDEYYSDQENFEQSSDIDMTTSPGLFVANAEVSRGEIVFEYGLLLPQISRHSAQ